MPRWKIVQMISRPNTNNPYLHDGIEEAGISQIAEALQSNTRTLYTTDNGTFLAVLGKIILQPSYNQTKCVRQNVYIAKNNLHEATHL